MADLGVTPFDTVLRLAVALVMGALVGWERERQRRPAGLRTHMLVALGSCGFALAGLQIHTAALGENAQTTRVDVLRVLEGITGGIGFLGAGAIIHARGRVEGLTTAAGIWAVAAASLAAAVASWVLVGTIAVFTLFTLLVLQKLEKKGRPGPTVEGESEGGESATRE